MHHGQSHNFIYAYNMADRWSGETQLYSSTMI